MADVFISYKTEDKGWAEKINLVLKSAGYTTWWDNSLLAGVRYNDEILEQLKLASVTIVIWSKKSWTSTWVKEEALFSRDQDKLLPIKIDDVEIGVPFYSIQTINFEKWSGEENCETVNILLNSVKKYVPKTLRTNFSVNLFWMRFNDNFTKNDDEIALFLQRIVNTCSSVDIELKLIKGWDFFRRPNEPQFQNVRKDDLNIFLYFGKIIMDMFAEDIACPELRNAARNLNPYVLHIGHEDFSIDNLNFFCSPDRKVEIKENNLPSPDTLLGDSTIESLSLYIIFWVMKTKRNILHINQDHK